MIATYGDITAIHVIHGEPTRALEVQSPLMADDIPYWGDDQYVTVISERAMVQAHLEAQRDRLASVNLLGDRIRLHMQRVDTLVKASKVRGRRDGRGTPASSAGAGSRAP